MKLISLVVLVACSKPAGPELFGAKVTPPDALANITLGMPEAELQRLAPDAKNDPDQGYLLATPASNVKVYALVMDGRVVHMYIDYKGADALEVLTKAWGPPDAETDRQRKDQLAWRSTTTGWRASLYCNPEGKDPFCTITFAPYKPVETMFGPAVAPLPPLDRATLRMPVAELRQLTGYAFATAIERRELAYDGVDLSVTAPDGVLYQIEYSVPNAVRPALEKVWGPGVSNEGWTRWFDAKAGWLASLEHNELRFGPYEPFAKQVARLEQIAQSSTLEAARAAHPEVRWEESKDDVALDLPLTEYAPEITMLGTWQPAAVFFFTNDTAHGSHIGLSLRKNSRDPVLAELAKLWGAPKIEKHDDETVWRWPRHGMLSQLEDLSPSMLIGPSS